MVRTQCRYSIESTLFRAGRKGEFSCAVCHEFISKCSQLGISSDLRQRLFRSFHLITTRSTVWGVVQCAMHKFLPTLTARLPSNGLTAVILSVEWFRDVQMPRCQSVRYYYKMNVFILSCRPPIPGLNRVTSLLWVPTASQRASSTRVMWFPLDSQNTTPFKPHEEREGQATLLHSLMLWFLPLDSHPGFSFFFHYGIHF